MEYKIAFVGFGSIAKRHLINLTELLKQKHIEYEIDLVRLNKQQKLDEKYSNVINEILTIDEIDDRIYDIIFITNPTYLHYETLLRLNDNGRYFFIEKPLFHQTEKLNLDIFTMMTNKIYYVACPLRYTKGILFIKNEINHDDIYSVRAISSSYLPDWREGVDYRQTYSANKELGGGVSIDLIHEWDYIKYLFGSPEEIYNIKGKKSDLEINSDDISVYIAKIRDKVIEIHLDYFGKKTIRKIELIMKTDTVEVDLIEGKITYLNENKIIELNDQRDDYQMREIEYFLDIIQGNSKNTNDLRVAFNTLKIANGEVE